MENHIPTLISNAGPIGATAVLVLLAVFFVMRRFGWTGLGEKSRIATARGHESGATLDNLDARVKAMEGELQNRPTRDDFEHLQADVHKLEVATARIDERQIGMEKTAMATNASVQRIETFLIRISKGES